MWTELVLLGLYVLLGPVAWVLLAGVSAVGMERMSQLGRKRRSHVRKPPQKVSILIPAKDEAARIGDCLRSALAQDYTDFEVIAVDDRSDDGTGAAMDEVAQTDPRLKIIHLAGGDLPEGWTGKCNALHRASLVASGQWLLLVDSDVILRPHALSTVVAVAAGRHYGLLSIFPSLECHGFLEQLVIPLAGAALMILHLVALTNTDWRPDAFANGQFLLIRRDVYDAIGGHQAVRMQFCEDIEIARLVKARQLRPRICWGTQLASVRMYSSMATIRRGWARIFYAAGRGRPWRSITGILAVIFCGLSVYFAAAWGILSLWRPAGWLAPVWLIAAALHFLIMTTLLAMAYRSTGNPRSRALGFPIAGILLITVFVKSIRLCLTGRLEWRGTQYNTGRRYAPVNHDG